MCTWGSCLTLFIFPSQLQACVLQPYLRGGQWNRRRYFTEAQQLLACTHGRLRERGLAPWARRRSAPSQSCRPDEAPAGSPAKGKLHICQPGDAAPAMPGPPRLPTSFSPPLAPACGEPRPISWATSRNARAGGRAVTPLPSSVRMSGTPRPRAICEFIVCPRQLSSWAAHGTAALCTAPGGSCGQHYQTHLASFREIFLVN